jgi:hypothetical protein
MKKKYIFYVLIPFICMNKSQFDAMLKLFDKVPKPFGRPGRHGFL